MPSNINPGIPTGPDAQILQLQQNFGHAKAEIDALQAASGAQGPQGSQGVQGSTGPQGSAGSGGSQGAQGAAGAQGAPGTPGSGGAATAIMGDPFTTPTTGLPDGTLLIDENTGSLMFKLGTQWLGVSM